MTSQGLQLEGQTETENIGRGAERSPKKNKEVGSCTALEGMVKTSPRMIMSTSQLLYRRNGPPTAFSIHFSSCTVEGRDESQGDLIEIKRSEDRTLRDVH